MLLKKLKYILYPVILVILCLANLPALAVTPHEDPEVAKTVFSGIALFDYMRYGNSSTANTNLCFLSQT